MKQLIKRLLALADVQVSRQSAAFAAHVSAQTQIIGLTGAADAFAHYILRRDQLSSDDELADFMRFYADNWQQSASQWSQDIFVMYAVRSRHGGTFLEIGGADGFTHSNTYSLERHLGWRGTLVEPDPEQFKILQRARPNNELINAAISPTGFEEKLRLRRVGQLSSLEGFEGSDLHSKTRTDSNVFAEVRCVNLTNLLAARHFDYFSFDVEGAELQILKGIEWSRIHKPEVLTIEHNFRDDDRSAMNSLLKDQGYRLRFENHDWLRRGDIWATLAST